MRIIQITDPHLGEVGEDTFGVDVRANFQLVLEAAMQLNPDHLVITGDLCFRHGSAEVYAWVKYLLDSLSVPYDLISGNHDDSVQMATSFGLLEYLHDKELYFLKYFNDIPVLFLDTAVGQVSLQQKDWLSRQMQTIQQNCIIFMHHPPLLAGVPYMDMNYPLLDCEAIQNIF
ncbi:MAG: metallophosphoesterase [Saprospiraceae bacterium]|nr:metallophosphoesterase [Saprospiraceae bacterium]